MTKHEAFVVVMEMLGEAYGKSLTGPMLDAYWLVLEQLPEAEMRGAARAALSRPSGFMPGPGELLAFARPQRNPAVEAATAWDGVRRAIDRIDYTVSQIDFGPHVNAVIRQLGGWDALCRAKLPDLDVWKRKEFERLYVAFSGQQIGDVGRALEGSIEGKAYPPHVVAIEGIPSQPVGALEPIGANGSGRAIVHALADRKS